MTFSYPPDLLPVIKEVHVGHEVIAPLPPEVVLQHALEVAFQASFTQDEGRPSRVSLILASATNLTETAWAEEALVRFEDVLPFEVQELRRLCSITTPDSSALVLSYDEQGVITIVGALGFGRARRDFKAGALPSAIALPGEVHLISHAPGSLEVHSPLTYLAGLRGGAIIGLVRQGLPIAPVDHGYGRNRWSDSAEPLPDRRRRRRTIRRTARRIRRAGLAARPHRSSKAAVHGVAVRLRRPPPRRGPRARTPTREPAAADATHRAAGAGAQGRHDHRRTPQNEEGRPRTRAARLPRRRTRVASRYVLGRAAKARLFRGEQGGSLRRIQWKRIWDRAKVEVPDLPPDFRPHDLRHTANTIAAATGASTRELMQRMGHASSDAALRYQHATTERDRAIADLVGQLVRGRSPATSLGRVPPAVGPSPVD